MPPLLLTFAARVSDGLPLVAAYAQTTMNMDEQIWEAKQILRNLNARCVIKSMVWIVCVCLRAGINYIVSKPLVSFDFGFHTMAHFVHAVHMHCN